jgi:hypothetical protein
VNDAVCVGEGDTGGVQVAVALREADDDGVAELDSLQLGVELAMYSRLPGATLVYMPFSVRLPTANVTEHVTYGYTSVAVTTPSVSTTL